MPINRQLKIFFVYVCVCVVEARQEMLDEAQHKLTDLLSSTEGKVDK